MFSQGCSKDSGSNVGAGEPAGQEPRSGEAVADSGMDGRSAIDQASAMEVLAGHGDRSRIYENVEQMIGQPWSKWVDHYGCESPEPDQAVLPRESDCMKLPREDMPIYGLCPEKETFVAVVCSFCEATVHPHGLANHYRIWHSGMISGTDPIPELPEQNPIKRSSSSKKSTLMKTKSKRPLVAPNSPATVASPQVPDETVDVYDNDGAPRSPVLQPVVSLTPLDSPSTPATSSVQTATFSSNVDTLSQLQGSTAPARRRPKTDRKYLPIKEREYDPNKHCGVWIGENNRPCTRSLTCKSHSLSMRRAVSGRSKNFDLLLADHRAAKEAQKQKQMAVDMDLQPDLSAAATSAMNISRTSIPPTPVQSLPDLNTNVPKALSLLSISPSFSKTLSICIPRVSVAPSHSAPVLQTSTIAFHAGNIITSGNDQVELEDVNWLKSHPRPLAVCSFSERKIGALVTNSRRLEVVREGLKEALTNGPIRSPLGNDFYGNALQASTNHATATIKTVLTNICTKSNFLGPRGKLLVPNIGISKNHKMPVQSSVRKSNTILPSTSGNNIQLAGSLKAALQKPQHMAIKPLNQNVSSKETSGKTGQFHIPNILSGSLKRQGEVTKGTANVKRAKRKPTANVNPAEIIGSLFARKTMPLVTVAIANGNESGDTKNVFTELQKGTTNSDAKGGATNIKAVTQNVRIAAAPSTVQIAAAPQITYLTTTPVTFQQIPVLSQQVISQIQLQSKNSSGGGSQSIPLKLSLATTTTMDHTNSDS